MRLHYLAVLPLLSLSAQQYPDAAKLIGQNQQALKKYQSYQYVSDSVMDMTIAGHATKMETTTSIAVATPDKFRVEVTSENMPGITIVGDGEYTWYYMHSQKQFMKSDAVWAVERMAGLGDSFSDKLTPASAAKVIGEEAIEADGENHDCWVVESKLDKNVTTLWIDKKSGIDWQTTMSGKMKDGAMPGSVEMRMKETKHGVKLGENPPDSLFTFTPPEGAKEIAEAEFPGMKKLDRAGQAAPAFTVKASDGRTYSPQELKGNVVLLDFCAARYTPCRNEVSALNQLQKEGQTVVLALDVGEDRAAHSNPTAMAYPTAMASAEIVTAYAVRAYPTHVVIGRDGRIVGQQMGSGEEPLRQLLARAEGNSQAPAEGAALQPEPAAMPAAARADGVQAYVPSLMPLVFAHPVVPDAAKGIAGWVQMLVTIDPTGKVTKAEALSGPKELRQAASDAARQQKYRPVIRDGHPVFAYTNTTVNFTAKGKSPMDDLDTDGEMQASQKLAEVAAGLPRSKAQVLADLEQDSGGGDEMRRFYALPGIAKAAFTAGETDKAATYANELLLAAPQPHDLNYGNAIHDGNMVLGLLAVRQGNVRVASQYLLDAGNTPGSPQLDSFGPDMSLAKALLEKGERDAVLEYFARCRTFWKMGKGQLDAWTDTVHGGGMPDMMMNLRLGN